VEEIAPYAQRFGVELSLIEATQSMRVLGDRDRLKQVSPIDFECVNIRPSAQRF